MGRLSSIIWMDPNAITGVLLREVEGDVTYAGEAVTHEGTHGTGPEPKKATATELAERRNESPSPQASRGTVSC